MARLSCSPSNTSDQSRLLASTVDTCQSKCGSTGQRWREEAIDRSCAFEPSQGGWNKSPYPRRWRNSGNNQHHNWAGSSTTYSDHEWSHHLTALTSELKVTVKNQRHLELVQFGWAQVLALLFALAAVQEFDYLRADSLRQQRQLCCLIWPISTVLDITEQMVSTHPQPLATQQQVIVQQFLDSINCVHFVLVLNVPVANGQKAFNPCRESPKRFHRLSIGQHHMMSDKRTGYIPSCFCTNSPTSWQRW